MLTLIQSSFSWSTLRSWVCNIEEREVWSGRGVCGAYEENIGRGKGNTGKSPERNEKVCRLEEEQERIILSERSSNVKHKRSEVVDEGEKIGEVNRAFHGPLQNKEYHIN